MATPLQHALARRPDAVDEDEYECMACKQWKPWFCYAGMFQLVAPFKDATHSHWLDFQRDDGGHRFACDYCVQISSC